MNYIKLSEYAKNHSIHYQTAYRHFKKGIVKGYQDPRTQTIYIEKDEGDEKGNKVALYARVSSTQNKKNLEAQMNRLEQYAIAKGYQIILKESEIASGLNDNRKKLDKILKNNDYGILIVEHKDRLTRFGFNHLDTLMYLTGRKIEVINTAEENKNDLMEDFVSIITSFCARLYGQRRTRRKTEKIIKELGRD